MSSNGGIEVHQALHGYADGHMLLASSTEVPRMARAELQRLSDRSGPGEEAGFTSYLTAYPVPKMQSYAFARTWTAPEMPRPGCVWTHTLLIAEKQLGGLPTLAALLPFFQRPNAPIDAVRERYTHSLSVNLSASERPPVQTGREQTVALVHTLYTTHQPVFVEVDSSGEVEPLFLAVWAQQWPQLRQAFSFCTGSLAARNVGGRPMDLQAIPHGRAARVRRGETEAVFVGEGDVGRAATMWAVVAAVDIHGDPPSPDLHRFLRTFGAEMGRDRQRFPNVVQALAALGVSGGTPAEQIHRVGQLFPGPSEATRLKNALLGVPRPLLRGLSAVDALFAVYSLESPEPYSGPGVADVARLRTLWHDGPSVREALLRRWWQEPLNQLGHQAIQTLLQEMEPDLLATALPDDTGSVQAAVSVKPEIILTNPFWDLSSVSVRASIASALSQHSSPELWRRAVRTGIRSRTSELLLEFVDVLGALAATVILEEAVNDPALPDHPVADEILRRQPGSVWSWLDKAGGTFDVAAPLLVRHTEVVEASVVDPGSALRVAQRAAREPLESVPADVVAAALLGVGLTRRSTLSRDLIEASFGRVHRALEAGRLSQGANTVLRRVLFPGAATVSSDALRRRLVQRYEAEKWGWTSLVRSVAGGSVVEHLLRLFAPPPKKPSSGRRR